MNVDWLCAADPDSLMISFPRWKGIAGWGNRSTETNRVNLLSLTCCFFILLFFSSSWAADRYYVKTHNSSLSSQNPSKCLWTHVLFFSVISPPSLWFLYPSKRCFKTPRKKCKTLHFIENNQSELCSNCFPLRVIDEKSGNGNDEHYLSTSDVWLLFTLKNKKV